MKLYSSTPDPRISEISEIVVKDSQRAPEGQLGQVEEEQTPSSSFPKFTHEKDNLQDAFNKFENSSKHSTFTNKIPITHEENSLPKQQLQDSACKRSKQISSPFLTYVNLCKPLLQAEQPHLNLIQQIEELAARLVTFLSRLGSLWIFKIFFSFAKYCLLKPDKRGFFVVGNHVDLTIFFAF